MNLVAIKPFFETIYCLRNNEEILLYEKALTIDPADEKDVRDFLSSEWDNECLEYPGCPPPFNEKAALWGARTLYLASELLLDRGLKFEDAHSLLPSFQDRITASAMLSADLCLRMLPTVVVSLKMIDPEDLLVPVLEAHLKQFHYSAIRHFVEEETLDFSLLKDDACLMQLYADRVIERKDKVLAQRAEVAQFLSASMGYYKQYFWKE